MIEDESISQETIDKSEDLQYNPAQDSESAQEAYREALVSGNADEIARTEALLKKYLEPQDKEPIAEVTPPQAEAAPAEPSKEAEQQEPAKDGGASTSNWLDTLSPEIKANVEQLIAQNQYLDQYKRSNEGRVAGLQRKADEEARKAKELEARMAQLTQPQTAQDKATVSKITYLTDRINKVKSTDPELAELLELTRDALLEQAESVKGSVPNVDIQEIITLKERLAQQEEEIRVEKARAELDRLVPNGTAIIDSPHWVEFKNSLSPRVREVLDLSDDPRDYANMMPLYAQWADNYNKAHGYTNQPQQAVNTPATSVDPRASAIQATRQQALQTGVVGGSAPASPTRKPTLAEILANPALLEKEQERILAEERKRIMGN